MPIWGRELLIIAAVGIVAALLHALVHRGVRSETLIKHNDVAGFVFSVIGVIYAVVLGFVVVVVWEKFDAANEHVQIEAAAASDLYRTVGALDPPFAVRLRREIETYAHHEIDIEWPLMAANALPHAGLSSGLETVVAEVNHYQPKGPGQINVHQIALADAERLLDARRQRISDTEPSVPWLLWFALICGAAATLGFSYLFGVENRRAQLIMSGVLAGVIAILFVVVHEFDSPFSGTVGVSHLAWNDFLARIPFMK
ncbi:MAG TPA: DUF4239 domain-containing protein [Candidatus Acidoferrales bacterium]|jgi:hypothetical protein|nr:DUF4239 domain-containing protein [Candidatus Acidoferrales bacterium]